MKFQKERLIRITINILGCLLFLFGIIHFDSSNFEDVEGYYAVIIGLLIIFGSIGIIKRKQWARKLIIALLILDIPRYLLSTKEVLKMLYTEEHISLFFSDAELLVDSVYREVIRNVIYSGVILISAFFFLYPKVREQFK